MNNVASENKCFFLIAEEVKWGIGEHLKPFNPIYNGIGWFVEEKHYESVLQISRQANMKLLEWPLNGETFADLRRRNKRDFLNEKVIKTRLFIDGLKKGLGIDAFDNKDLLSGDISERLKETQEGKKLLGHLREQEQLQKQIKNEENISKIKPSHLPIVPIKERIRSHYEILKKYRGKKHLGLCVKTISEFNDKMLGLRKLILLAAAPNVGKTALTIQLAEEILLTEPDACLVYVSLEMDAEEIFTRMNLYLSGLSFNTYVLGSQQAESESEYQNFFTQEELRKIDNAVKEIEQIGDRLQIIDMSSCTYFSADIIIEYVNRLKDKTGCQRAIVVIDYLQVWPLPLEARFSSDIEADKWRIGEIKKIRDSLNTINQDPVIVISEARKPSDSGNAWAGGLADVMGSARGTYTPDAVLLLNLLSDEKLKDLWKDKKMPEISSKWEGVDIGKAKDDSKIRNFLAHHGIAFCSLEMPKGRDGMKKFSILLAFNFHSNKFEKVNWQNILVLAMDEKHSDKKWKK